MIDFADDPDLYFLHHVDSQEAIFESDLPVWAQYMIERGWIEGMIMWPDSAACEGYQLTEAGEAKLDPELRGTLFPPPNKPTFMDPGWPRDVAHLRKAPIDG